MKTSTKTLLATAVSAIALACAGGAYAQAGGGAGGSAGGGGGGAAGSAGGGGGARGGTAPSGNSLEQPGIQPGMGNANNTGGYGSPGTTRSHSGRATTSPRKHHQSPSGTTGDYSPDQEGQTYHGNGQQ